jgi:uncharacterized membrane protein YhaH (DUF805 family)
MSDLAEPIGLTLIGIAVGVFVLRLALRRQADRRWSQLAAMVIVLILVGLFGLVVVSALAIPFD